LRKKSILSRAADSLRSGAGESVRVAPKATATIGGTAVTNRTAASIQVQVAEDGAVTVTDCCLEEQGK
jgi:hypothetical protein